MDNIKKLTDPKNNPIYKFAVKHKKLSIVIGAILLIMFGYLLNDSGNKTTENKYPEVDVNGLVASEACEKLREKGWIIESVYKGSESSDCSNTTDRATTVSYYDDKASLYLKDDKEKTEPKKEESKPAEKKPTEQKTEKPREEEISYNDALRMCTVMEAFDIHKTGVGRKTDNAFNDAKETCDWMFRSVYKNDEKKFISDVKTDWNDRKDEKIDGEAMPYYLGILGW